MHPKHDPLIAERHDWNECDWRRVLFTDKSRYSVEYSIRSIMKLRERSTRNKHSFVQERPQYKKRGLVKWVKIMIGGRTDLRVPGMEF